MQDCASTNEGRLGFLMGGRVRSEQHELNGRPQDVWQHDGTQFRTEREPQRRVPLRSSTTDKYPIELSLSSYPIANPSLSCMQVGLHSRQLPTAHAKAQITEVQQKTTKDAKTESPTGENIRNGGPGLLC
jgi:hypothetical protein